jgi:hypothetical protein
MHAPPSQRDTRSTQQWQHVQPPHNTLSMQAVYTIQNIQLITGQSLPKYTKPRKTELSRCAHLMHRSAPNTIPTPNQAMKPCSAIILQAGWQYWRHIWGIQHEKHAHPRRFCSKNTKAAQL